MEKKILRLILKSLINSCLKLFSNYTSYYSQEGEDRFLYENIFQHIESHFGSYIEIGALDGKKFSNTLFFEKKLGWTGILIEPNPIMFKKLKRNRFKNVLYNCIISNSECDLEYVYFDNPNLSAVSGITSTLTPNNKKTFFSKESKWISEMKNSQLKKIHLKPKSLDTIISESKITKFDFCSLDVEGHELNVLNSYSFNYEINFFLIEVNPRSEQIKKLMFDNNYSFLGHIAHNELYALKNLVTRHDFLKKLIRH